MTKILYVVASKCLPPLATTCHHLPHHYFSYTKVSPCFVFCLIKITRRNFCIGKIVVWQMVASGGKSWQMVAFGFRPFLCSPTWIQYVLRYQVVPQPPFHQNHHGGCVLLGAGVVEYFQPQSRVDLMPDGWGSSVGHHDYTNDKSDNCGKNKNLQPTSPSDDLKNNQEDNGFWDWQNHCLGVTLWWNVRSMPERVGSPCERRLQEKW
jgi:hypothetical protein